MVNSKLFEILRFYFFNKFLGYSLPSSDNFGKREGTFENFPESFTNGKLNAKKDESQLISHGKFYNEKVQLWGQSYNTFYTLRLLRIKC